MPCTTARRAWKRGTCTRERHKASVGGSGHPSIGFDEPHWGHVVVTHMQDPPLETSPELQFSGYWSKKNAFHNSNFNSVLLSTSNALTSPFARVRWICTIHAITQHAGNSQGTLPGGQQSSRDCVPHECAFIIPSSKQQTRRGVQFDAPQRRG